MSPLVFVPSCAGFGTLRSSSATLPAGGLSSGMAMSNNGFGTMTTMSNGGPLMGVGFSKYFTPSHLQRGVQLVLRLGFSGNVLLV